MIPPKHAVEEDPIDAEAAKGSEVVLQRALADGGRSETRDHYCSEFADVVASEQVREMMKGQVLIDDRILVSGLGFLNTRTMLTHRGKPEVGEFSGFASLHLLI